MSLALTQFESNRISVMCSINSKTSFTLIYVKLINLKLNELEHNLKEIHTLEAIFNNYQKGVECYRVFEDEFVFVCINTAAAKTLIMALISNINLSVHYLYVENRQLPALNYLRHVYTKNLAINPVHENILRKGLDIDEFTTVFQPILHKSKQLSLEALSRWNSKDLGIIPPNIFIPILDNEGLLINLTKKIINESVEILNKYKEIDYITINLTASMVRDISWLWNHLNEIGFHDNKRIAFELTEASLTGVEVSENLKQIRNRGHLLFIDDFGSGYSNFQYLATFQFDGVKLDRLFIGDQSNKKVIVLLSKFIKDLDLKFIIEGVERQDQLSLLLEMKYDAVQGYYISYPLNRDDLGMFLGKTNKGLMEII